MEKKKILVIDDDEAIRKSLQETLVGVGFEVWTERGGAARWVKAVSEKPELLVIDVEMPVMDGMEMLKKLRESGDWGKTVPAVILTNYDTSDKVIQGVLENEPSMYLLKAKITPEEIADRIKEKLGQTPSNPAPSEV